MWYPILLVFGVVAGWVGCFFVMRNNPSYLNIDKLGKDKLQDIKKKVDDLLK